MVSSTPCDPCQCANWPVEPEFVLDGSESSHEKRHLTRGRKRYEGSNHLGNVLVVFSDRKLPLNSGSTVTGYQADVHAHSDYYPFGMVMEERTGSAEGYRFGFQGQETDDEVYGSENAVSFKYRVHDARIGRFLSIDPLAPEYPWNSPYAFSENRVIRFIELEGAETDDPFEDLDPFTGAIVRILSALDQRGSQINEQIGVEPTLENNLNTATAELGLFISPFAEGQLLVQTSPGGVNPGTVTKEITLETVTQTGKRTPWWKRLGNWFSGLFRKPQRPQQAQLVQQAQANAGGGYHPLRSRAIEISEKLTEGLPSQVQNGVTVAVGVDRSGKTYVSVNSGALQDNTILERLRSQEFLNPGETLVNAASGRNHAENNMIMQVSNLDRIEVSRPICQGCGSLIDVTQIQTSTPRRNPPSMPLFDQN